MLNELSGLDESPVTASPARTADDLHSRLRAAVEEVFGIDFENEGAAPPITASYSGHLLIDSVEAYDKLDTAFAPLDHVPVFLVENGQQVVRAVRGRIQPQPRPIWPNAVLFGLTILSLLFVGASFYGNVSGPADLMRGWPYAICIILILGTHELGHYFAARYHKVAVTLPYFIPMPVGLGTMGAFIQLRQPMRNRRVLLDIGAAGPLAGMIVAIPILLIGLKTSPVFMTQNWNVFWLRPNPDSFIQEGNSILYAVAKCLVFGRFLPDGLWDVYINQVATAGWTGLLVTALNLIPVGQLDGGHVAYSLFGERARLAFGPALVILGGLAVFYRYDGWIIWLILLLWLGRVYAVPLDQITQLDNRRRVIAIIALIVFVLVFTPAPLQQIFVGNQ